MTNKITDLEKFALEQIFRPYQNMCGFGDKRLEKLPMKIGEIVDFAKDNPEWWELVIDRIKRCKFTFPSYIQHELVTFIKEENN